MRSAKDYLEREAQRLLASAREVTRGAEDENRNLTDEEKGKVEKTLSDVTMLKTRVKELEDNEDLQNAIDQMGQIPQAVGGGDGQPVVAQTLGEAFVASPEYKALRERGFAANWSTGAFEIKVPQFGGFGYKAVGDSATVSGEGMSHITQPDVAQPQLLPGVRGPVEQRLTIADLFAQGTTDTTSIKYLEETVTDNNAAAVLEGGVKPGSYIEITDVDEPVRKLATFLAISDEMLEDEAALVSYINNRLALFVRQEEEDQLLNGNGTNPNLSGLLDRAIGTSNQAEIGGSTMFDAVYAGITDVRINGGLEPDAMVIHPMDQARLAISKGASEDAYFSGGPYAAPRQNPWGLRAVITTAISQGSVLVGAFREGAQIFRRGGLTVEASNSHSDWFRKNTTALRAEERLALAVYRPAAFSLSTLGS